MGHPEKSPPGPAGKRTRPGLQRSDLGAQLCIAWHPQIQKSKSRSSGYGVLWTPTGVRKTDLTPYSRKARLGLG